ncbi:Hsp20/alpha crystallin family protein [Arenibaculum pallidiluteum]|uniref:Hsp20/alpha crystallin family protein n=1 Tax=Arenibaculum pallidiluteum TaxID=2812559 RepID=UPI001A97B720|nr:Hsp20/alpha crystallin family protein [Arenibaculum pallidiluteum]
MQRRDRGLSMWAEACEMLDRAERLHRQFFTPVASAAHPVWEPPIDVYETDAEYVLVVALPGVAPGSVEVTIERRTLTVLAERHLPALSGRAAIHRLEIPQGRFERRLELPPVPLELGRRDLVDGCLVLTFLKRR